MRRGETAEAALSTARRLAALFTEDRARIAAAGRRAGSALRVHDAFEARPILSLPAARAATGLSFPAASSGVDLLASARIAHERTGRRRNRIFAYDRYLALLNEGTEAGCAWAAVDFG